MKTAKKLFSLFLVLAMTLTMGTVMLAAGATSYTITVNNAVKGQTYTAYKVLDLVYSGDTYSYTIDSGSTFYGVISGYTDGLKLTQVGSTTTYIVEKKDGFDAATLAKELMEVVTSDTIPAASDTASDNTVTLDVTTSGAGYYLVDSSLGSLCALDSTNNSATVEDKNSLPSIEKFVEGKVGYGSSTTAQIGDTVNFKLKVNTGTYTPAEGDGVSGTGINADYVITDTLPEGMTYTAITSVTVNGDTWSAPTDYTATYVGDLLTITLKKESLAKLPQNTDIIIIYTATLDADAVVDGDGNTNTVKLTYNDYSPVEKDATVYTRQFDIVKTDSSYVLLDGAEFSLYTTQTGGEAIKLVAVDADGDGITDYYRVATDEDTDTTTTIVAKGGRVNVRGLDGTVYYLEETKTPAGYNPLPARVEVDLTDGSNTTTMDKDATTWDETKGGVQITNNTGAELPSTGGMGTTIFYIVGAVLLIGAGVLLVVRKRMSMEKQVNKSDF